MRLGKQRPPRTPPEEESRALLSTSPAHCVSSGAMSRASSCSSIESDDSHGNAQLTIAAAAERMLSKRYYLSQPVKIRDYSFLCHFNSHVFKLL